MRKMLFIAAGVAVLAVVAVPYVIGQQIETAFRSTLADASAHYPYPVTLVHYRRGVFSAEAETRHDLTLGPAVGTGAPSAAAAGRAISMTLRHAISHGPRWDGLRLARIVNTLRLDDRLAAQAAVLFGAAEPLTAVVDVGFAGDLRGTVRSPPFAGSGVPSGWSWAGLSGRFRLSGGRFEGQLDGDGLRIGDGELEVGAIALRADLAAIAGGLWTGRFDSRFGSLAYRGPGGALRIDGLALASDTRDQDGDLRSDNRIRMESMKLDALQIDDGQLQLIIDSLDAGALSVLSEALNRHSAAIARGDTGDAERSAIAPALSAVAAGQPRARLEALSFRAPSGAFMARGELRYVGDAELGDFAPLTDVIASLDVEAPVALIEAMLTGHAARPGPGAPVPSAEQAAVIARTTLASLVSQGLVTVDDNGIGRSALRFDHGMLSINGNALSALNP